MQRDCYYILVYHCGISTPATILNQDKPYYVCIYYTVCRVYRISFLHQGELPNFELQETRYLGLLQTFDPMLVQLAIKLDRYIHNN